MIHEALLGKCLTAWPDRPALDPAEWPYTREELEAEITKCMDVIAEVLA